MPCPSKTETTREYPVQAFHFVAGPLLFEEDAGDDANIPIKMLARSAKPVFHRYWGKIAHDLSGMSRKAVVPVDWLHWDDELIGFIDTDKVTSRGLEVSGQLVPYTAKPDDRASEIAYKGKRGVPYEASIDFHGDGVVIEEIANGASVKVNGYKFEGPGIVVRKWPLRGVAICAHGADPNTQTKFTEGEGKTVSVRILTKEQQTMTVDNKTADGQADEPLTKRGFFDALAGAFGLNSTTAGGDDAAGDGESEAGKPKPGSDDAQLTEAESGAGTKKTPPETPAETRVEPTAAQLMAEMKKFSEAFGDEGPKLFADGLSFADAAVRVIKKLREQTGALEKRLSSVDRGDGEGADFSPGEDDDPVTKRTRELALKVGENTARFAAGMKLRRPKGG